MHVDRVRVAEKWDEGWNYWGWESGDALSPLDKAIVALGMASSKGAPYPGEGRVAGCRLRLLPPSRCDGPERLGDRAAAPALAELLRKPGMAATSTTRLPRPRRTTPSMPAT